MAIYVPGVPQYFPKFQPFTPDFKFLANVLEARQNKYNTNFKALNEQYNRVVYGDLSKAETKEARDNFVNQLGTQLEKISGMDLSLAENVNAAKGVFQPFFEEDLIVKDLLYTKQYKKQLSRADLLRSSPNQDIRQSYWREGVDGLNYRMQDFINASREEALSMALPQYVKNPNLYNKGMEYLKGQGYDVVIEKTSDGSFFRVKETNGKNITTQALEDVKAALSSDPEIQEGYAEKAFVDSRRAAERGVRDGMYATIQEGIDAYNVNYLEGMQVKLASEISDDEKVIARLQKKLDDYKTQVDLGYAPVPGSEDDIKMQEVMLSLQGLQMRKSRNESTLARIGDAFMSEDPMTDIRNQAWSFMMTANMDKDFRSAALRYSDISRKINYVVDEQKKMEQQAYYDELKAKREQAKKDAKDKLDGKPLPPVAQVGASVVMGTDEAGNIIAQDPVKFDDISPVDVNDVVFVNEKGRSTVAKAEYIVNAATTNNYITADELDKLGITGYTSQKVTAEKFRDLLLDPRNNAQIQKLFEEYKDSDQYIYDNIKEQEEIVNFSQNEAYKTYFENSEQLKLVDKDFALITSEGVPFFVKKDGDKYTKLTREEFQSVIEENYKKGLIPEKVLKELEGVTANSGIYTEKIVDGKNGYSVDLNKVYVMPDRVKWEKGNTGEIRLNFGSIVEKNEDSTKEWISDLIASGDWEFPDNYKAEDYKKYKMQIKLKYVGEPELFKPSIADPFGVRPEPALKARFDKNKEYSLREIEKDQRRKIIETAKQKYGPNIQSGMFRSKYADVIGQSSGDIIIKANKIYDRQQDFIDRTIRKDPGFTYQDGSGRPILFQSYNAIEGLQGDDPENNLLTTYSATVGLTKAYKADELSSQIILGLRNQLSVEGTFVYRTAVVGDRSEMLTDGVPSEIMKSFDENVDDPNVTIVYNPAVVEDGKVVAKYTIKRTATTAKGKDEMYEVVFDQNKDVSESSLSKTKYLDPVMVRIDRGDNEFDINVRDPKGELADPINAGKIIMSKGLDGNIHFEGYTAVLQPNGNIKKVPFAEIVPATDPRIYNRKYKELKKSIYDMGLQVLDSKKRLTKSFNASK